jgi:hypothetical protein
MRYTGIDVDLSIHAHVKVTWRFATLLDKQKRLWGVRLPDDIPPLTPNSK